MRLLRTGAMKAPVLSPGKRLHACFSQVERSPFREDQSRTVYLVTFRNAALWLGLLSGLSALLGCSREGVTTSRLPDGTRELRCEHALWKCLLHVDDYCRGASYEVVRAADEQLVYGSDKSSVEARRSHAVVRCLKPGQSPKEPSRALPETPPVEPRPERPAGAPSSSSARADTEKLPQSERVCVPGSTQACVGVAACAGGQACLADGSGFGPCDCGPKESAPVPAAEPSPPNPAPPRRP